MWYDLASSLELTGQMVMFGFVLMGSQHPLATAGIALLFVFLAAMLVAETTAERRADGDPDEPLRARLEP